MKPFHAPHAQVRPGTGARAWIVAFVTAAVLVTTSRASFALEPVPPPGSPKIKTGFALVASGAIVVGVGAMIYVANENSGKSACVPCSRASWVLPTVLMGIGGAMFVTGGTFVTIGLVERSRAAPPTASLSIGPLSVSARFLF